MRLDELIDELLLSIASKLEPFPLLQFQSTCSRFARLPTDTSCWRGLCERAWADKPRYRLTPERDKWLNTNVPLSWQLRYMFFAQDSKRQIIDEAELRALTWYFNFSKSAGGDGKQTVRKVVFTENTLEVPDYPPLPWRLQLVDLPAAPGRDTGGAEAAAVPSRGMDFLGRFGPLTLMQQLMQALMVSPAPKRSEQYLLVANFPPHRVSRREDDWEWVIQNDNVIFVSCNEEAACRASA